MTGFPGHARPTLEMFSSPWHTQLWLIQKVTEIPAGGFLRKGLSHDLPFWGGGNFRGFLLVIEAKF